MTAPTPRTELRRAPQRGCHETASLHAILDEGLVCHVGVAIDGGARVMPTAYGRIGDHLYMHGSSANYTFRALKRGAEACVAVTLLDGLVLARSAFHSSMNYRSAIVYGVAQEVRDPEERLAALRAIVEHVMPGRWRDVRPPNREELLRTLVLRLSLAEASAKVRTGPPGEEEEDYALRVWGGVIPLRVEAGAPVGDDRLLDDVKPPPYATGYRRGEARLPILDPPRAPVRGGVNH